MSHNATAAAGMEASASMWFPDPSQLAGTRLFWPTISYGYMLYWASELISDGSELLLLIPSFAGIVGSIVLPVLGAVPDGMMVLFSGIGPLDVAQDQVAVGVGALAGSTIMLLCIPWFLCVLGGRVDIDEKDGSCLYGKRPKLTYDAWGGWGKSGIEPSDKVKVNAYLMLGTSVTYLVIQLPALYVDDQVLITPDTIQGELGQVRRESRYENTYAAVGCCMCVVFWLGYLVLMFKAGQAPEENVLPEAPAADSPEASQSGLGNVVVSTKSLGMSQGSLLPPRNRNYTSESILALAQENTLQLYLDDFRKSNVEELKGSMPQRSPKEKGLIQKVELDHNLMSVLRGLFKKYACRIDDDRLLDSREFETLFEEMKLGYAKEEIDDLFNRADINGDKHVNFQEFLVCFVNLAATPPSNAAKSISRNYSIGNSQPSKIMEESGNASDEMCGGSNDDSDDDDDNEFKDLPPDEMRRAVLMKSFWKMGLGTLIILIFSNPAVDVLAAIGNDLNVNPFYVSFILAPLASNASELVSSYNYAKKKTRNTITISLNTLEGAAVMNNTFCLGIFLGLVYYQGLAWKFTAETISILVVEALVFVYITVKKVQTVNDAFLVLALYPLSLGVVYVLENFFGID